jgi:predicted nucleic acid-binding protein
LIVVDASVLSVALVDVGDDGRRARGALSGQDLAAPDLADVEVLSVLRRQHLAGRLSLPRMRAAVADLAALPMQRIPALGLLPGATAHLRNLTAYDALYVALASALDAPLLTADARLAGAPRLGCRVQLLTT